MAVGAWYLKWLRTATPGNRSSISASSDRRCPHLRRHRIEDNTAERLMTWNPSGFSVHLGAPVQPHETESLQRLARYLLKPPVSLERLRYDPESCTVVYSSIRRGQQQTMTALDFLAEFTVHVPERGHHAVTYHGRAGNRSRGSRRKAQGAAALESPPDAEADAPDAPAREPSRKAFRLAWTALLKKVWGCDVLVCPRCRCPERMRVVAAIIEFSAAERILRHLGLFDQPRPPNPHCCASETPPLAGLWDETVAASAALAQSARPVQGPEDSDSDPHLKDDWPVDPPFSD